MEDAHLVDGSIEGMPDCSLYAVFDGHGGQYSAIFSAENLSRHLRESQAFREMDSSTGPEAAEKLGEALRMAFLGVDAELRTKIGELPSDRSGCTAIAAVVTPTHVICANAGDSRGIVRSAGSTIALSEDHKPWLPIEKARIEAAGGCVSMKRVDGELAVARALGDFQFKDSDLQPHEHKVSAVPDIVVHARVEEDEFVVLACDGIWDVLSNEMASAKVHELMLMGEGNCRLLCDELITHCLSMHSRDNMSALVVMFPHGGTLVGDGAGVQGLRQQREAAQAASEQDQAGVPPAGAPSG